MNNYGKKIAIVVGLALAAVGVTVGIAAAATTGASAPDATAVSSIAAAKAMPEIQVTLAPAPADKLATAAKVTSRTICAGDKTEIYCPTQTPDSVQLVSMTDSSQRSGAAFTSKLVYLMTWAGQDCSPSGMAGSDPEPAWMRTGCSHTEVVDSSTGKYVEAWTEPTSK